ncbi:hypothetical protein [Paracoccus sp. (in: a-proteobacteria)]|uniref:hypothetical protein n=1 Tax=Paracoccus sp. TaxID=267 RepID=UPI0026E08831|nr:hypothetical protein [Paracoccus sp. (in: a-proteobacteria)]MDO5648575.1 hypothetical protein [Paracoccus sp. (in: a-proteobacteria)]
MTHLYRLFGGVRRDYLIRAYVISAALLALIMWGVPQPALETATAPVRWAMTGYYLLCFVLFPFAKLVWDDIKAMLMGDSVWMLGGLLLLFAMVMKVIVNLFIWMFAPFIAPFGVAFVLWRNR